MNGRPSRSSLAGSQYLALRALARATGRTTAELLQLYALEGFLLRLVRTPHGDRLVLKGGLLLSAFAARRPTRAVDLLALNMPNDVDAVRRVVSDIAAVRVDDGLDLDAEGVAAELIREGGTYNGVRATVRGSLSTARFVFHVDVNVGDPVWPATRVTDIPRLLGTEPIRLIACPLVMVVAEKVVTAVQRGTANTRWRDFADLYLLSRILPLDGRELQRAIAEVAAFRAAPRVALLTVLEEFAAVGQARWALWRRKQGLEDRLPGELAEVAASVADFADPALAGRADGTTWNPMTRTWEPEE